MVQQAMKPKNSHHLSGLRVGLGLVAVLGLLVIPSAVVTDSAFASAACSGELKPTEGAGTTVNPYRVATAANLIWISLKRADADKSFEQHYLQTADIDLQGCTFTPIGDNTKPFSNLTPGLASYDGGGFVIRGLKVAGGGDAGLFGQSLGTIRNVGIENGLVSGSTNVGALVGYNRGSVFNSYSSGQVSATSAYVGGLVGLNTEVVENSYSTASVSGPQGVGGLIGIHCTTNASLKNSYATGSVVISPAGAAAAGGLFANGDPLCVQPNLGVVASFWDTQTTGQTEFTIAGKAEGRSTAQMKTLATYTTAPAWDIVQGWVPFDQDGTPKRIWGICPEFNSGYPFLLWQASSDPCVSAAAAAAPATTTNPTLAATGANVEWLLVPGLVAVIAGAGFLTVSRRKRSA